MANQDGYSIHFLGSGTSLAVDPDNYHSNMVIETPSGKKLLIDCGTDAKWSLKDQNYTFEDIDAVYISHLHCDHVGGLEWLGFSYYFKGHKRKINLYADESLVENLWEHVLRGGMSSIEGKQVQIEDFFNILPIHSHQFTWEGISFELVKTFHCKNAEVVLPSFGLFFSLANTKIFITTDTQFIPQELNNYFKRADLIFHDCEVEETASMVHTRYSELLNLEEEFKEKMWLYHSSSANQPNALNDGFLGFVQKGQKFFFKN